MKGSTQTVSAQPRSCHLLTAQRDRLSSILQWGHRAAGHLSGVVQPTPSPPIQLPGLDSLGGSSGPPLKGSIGGTPASNCPYPCLSFSWLSWSINSGQSQAFGEPCVRVGCHLTDTDHSAMCMHKGGGGGQNTLPWGPASEFLSTDKPPSMIQLERCSYFSRNYPPPPPLPHSSPSLLTRPQGHQWLLGTRSPSWSPDPLDPLMPTQCYPRMTGERPRG